MAQSLCSTLRTAALTVAPLLAVVVLAGCGADNKPALAAAAKAPLFAELPKSVQDSGTIQVGSSVDYPPFEFYEADGKTLAGFEPQLATLLEKQLGVKLVWNNASFDTLFSALRAKRYDVVYGATNDTAEREQTFDFVDYLQSSQGFVVAKGNPKGIKTEDDLCGKTVAAVRGGVQAQYLDKKATECSQAGKAKLTALTFAGNADEQLAVRQGKADALLENFPTAVSFAKESGGALEMVPGLQVEKRFYGMVFDKGNDQLRDTMAKAWQAIIDDGSYAKVLQEWKLSDIGVKKAGINAVASKASEG